jgi:hypothetical protein
MKIRKINPKGSMKMLSIIYEAIDYEIIPLVTAMNYTGIISTFSSCGGHTAGDITYVSFHCRVERIKKIIKIISKAEEDIIEKRYPYDIELSVVTQGDSPKGCITLILTIKHTKEKPYGFLEKAKTMDILTREFLYSVDKGEVPEKYKELVEQQVNWIPIKKLEEWSISKEIDFNTPISILCL